MLGLSIIRSLQNGDVLQLLDNKYMKEETRKKISDSKKGVSVKHNKQFKRGVPAWNKGKKTPLATREKQRQSKLISGIVPPSRKGVKLTEEHKAKIVHKKEKHWNWKGGINPINDTIRKSKEYKLWRTAVFERDNYTCIWCGQKGGELNADHIKPFAHYPELRFAIDNGRTLCVPCHKKTGTYGRGAIYRIKKCVATC